MHIVVVGSGPSGVHFAVTALERGHHVTLVDIGHQGVNIPLPDQNFRGLKALHPDPIRYFLGDGYEAAQLPASGKGKIREYYGLPASKNYVFERPGAFRMITQGFAPLVSFAAGGLAECWTGGAYTFTDGDLTPFGFGFDRLAPHYARVAERIGIGGLADDLADWYPIHDGLLPPIPLDRSSAILLSRYERRRERLATRDPGLRLGRSRQAALAAALGSRCGCTQCGRCLWGCPNGAFYTPSLTLSDCLRHPRFTYLPGHFASHYILASDGLIDALHAEPCNGPAVRIGGDAHVMACGTIGSANLFLRTHYHARGEIAELHGLMDNQQVLAPFLNLAMLGRPYDPSSYQYHQLAVGLEGVNPADFVHGQITTMTTGAAHPIIGQLPVGLRAGRRIFTTLRSALGVVNLNFSDTRRRGNMITLAQRGGDWPALDLRYAPSEDQHAAISQALRRVGRAMRTLGAPLVPGMAQIRSPGASVHYSGTLPISTDGGPFTVTESCQSNDFSNLFVIDGSVFPALPAKNLTFTLMANATRVAMEAF